MAKTKNTPRSRPLCPVCKDQLPPDETFEEHLVKCAKERHQCHVCATSFKKEEYLRRHIKHSHSESCSKAATTVKERRSDSDSNWDSDPDIEIGDQPILGRLIRKRTAPEPVMAPTRKSSKVDAEQPNQHAPVSKSSSATVSATSSTVGPGPRPLPSQPAVSARTSTATSEPSTHLVQVPRSSIVAPKPKTIDASTQCELQQSFGDLKECVHCGIFFKDPLMLYLHQGCHTINDPFMCNQCGKKCNDRQSFFMHITMEHRG